MGTVLTVYTFIVDRICGKLCNMLILTYSQRFSTLILLILVVNDRRRNLPTVPKTKTKTTKRMKMTTKWTPNRCYPEESQLCIPLTLWTIRISTKRYQTHQRCIPTSIIGEEWISCNSKSQLCHDHDFIWSATITTKTKRKTTTKGTIVRRPYRYHRRCYRHPLHSHSTTILREYQQMHQLSHHHKTWNNLLQHQHCSPYPRHCH